MERMTTYKEALKISMERYKELEEENKKLKAEKDKLYIDYENLSNCNIDLIQENEKLKEENEIIIKNADAIAHRNVELMKQVKELENQRIFSSAEYDLITLTSTTPQYELRKK